MKRWGLCALAALFCQISSAAALAAPTVTTRTETYEIFGNTAQELREQMALFGVTWRDGRKYDAVTTWFTRWRYTWESGFHACEITGVETSVEVVYRVPEWINREHAPSLLRRQWDLYMENLMVHENGHRDLGVAAAAEIEEAIARMPAHRTCEELEAAANARGKEVLEKFRGLEADYDRQTGHGRTQGAVFP